MSYFLKNEGKENQKASKTVKKTPNNGDIKSVAVRPPKIASNLLKTIAQSKIITQELETIDKSNIFDLESVTMEHPKSVTNISKLIQQLKIITQQPNKIKFKQS